MVAVSRRTFTVDERARVPFALIGVLLVVASATFVVAVQPDREPADPAVDVVMEQATGETRTALRQAVRTASANAARNPVLTRANTSVGRVLNESTTFRDALRIRIYRQARERLADVRVRRADVTANVSLPPVSNLSELRRAKEQVHLERLGVNDTAMRVHVENLTVRATRGNGTAGHRTLGLNVTVRTPVLALHERVSQFQQRLDRGIGRPGLLQGFTARLYALTGTRGLAFYGGAPIGNVVGTRHLELVTNSALLAEQRAVFGRSDAAGRRAQRRATARVALADAFTVIPHSGPWVTHLLGGNPPGPDVPALASVAGEQERSVMTDEMNVSVNETADYAFANLAESRNLSAVFEDVYSANVSLLTERARISGGTSPDWPGPPAAPGTWMLDDEETTFDYTVSNVSANGSPPTPPQGAHVLTTYTRHVTRNITRTREWVSGNETAQTHERSSIEYRVTIAAIGYHAPTADAPRQEIATVHQRGGPVGGPNLESIPARAVDRLIEQRGRAVIARRAANLSADTSNVTIRGDLPNGTALRWWVLRDLGAFRDRLRNVTTQVERGRLASFQAMPAGDLENRLAATRSQLLDAPRTYGSVAEKARVAARGALLRRVRERLRERRAARRGRQSNLGSVFSQVGAGSLDMLRNGLANATGDSQSTTGTDATSETDGGLHITSIDGSPPYLTTAEVGREFVPSVDRNEGIHPLATRNVNVFTSPYGDVVDTLLGGLLGQRVPLRAAASTLHGAESFDGSRNATLSRRRARLAEAVNESVGHVRDGARQTLEGYGIGDNRTERRAIVSEGLAEWDSNATRALALTNGSAAREIAAAATDGPGYNGSFAVVLRTNLQLTVEARLDDSTRINQGLVNRSHATTRRVARQAATEIASRGLDRASDAAMRRINRSFNRVQTGLPVLPTGTWYATVNLWYVETRGAYDRFAVRARRGSPTEPGRSLRYVRDGGAVRLDVDDDGVAERLGESDRVAFTNRMVVPMAVPPGMPGIGDTNGNWDERSAGWADWTVEGADPVPPTWE